MTRFRYIAGIWLLVLWFIGTSTTPAAESIERNPVFRSSSSNFTDLGSRNYPFKSIYVGNINGASVVNAGGGGISNVVNTVTNFQAWISNGVLYLAPFVITPPTGTNATFDLTTVTFDSTGHTFDESASSGGSGSGPTFDLTSATFDSSASTFDQQ